MWSQVARQNKVIHVLQGKIGQYRALLKSHSIPDTVAPDDSFLAADMAALVAAETAAEDRDTDPDDGARAGGDKGAIVPLSRAMAAVSLEGGAGAGAGGRDPKCVTCPDPPACCCVARTAALLRPHPATLLPRSCHLS